MEKSRAVSKMFDTDAFIAAVRDREALYNTKHENHTRKDIRVKLWDEIGQIMFPNWSTLDAREKNEKVETLKRKWKNLKDTYTKYARNYKKKGRRAATKSKIWVWADRMEPFRPYLICPKPASDVSEHTHTLDNTQNAYPSMDCMEEPEGVWLQRKWKSLKDCFNREIRLQRHSDPKKYRKKYELYDKLTFLLVNVSEPKPFKTIPLKTEVKRTQYEPESRPIRVAPQPKKIKLDDAAQKSEEDGDRLFLLSFLSDMKRLPLPTKYWVKMKFSEIMQQAAMSLNEYQESYPGDVFEFERVSPVPSDVSQTDVKIPSPSSSSDIYIHQDN